MTLLTQERERLRIKLPRRRIHLPKRQRIRLPLPLQAPHIRLQAPTGAEKAMVDAINPESLAYSLPGGLAKLSYPKWIYGPHLRYVEDLILRIFNGESIKVMVSMPPRHGKSLFLSRVFPAFFLGRFPDRRVMLITHSTDFSKGHSRFARNIIANFGEKVFGVKLSRETSSAGEWDVVEKGRKTATLGGMEALGAESSVMGKGAHLLLIDDIVKGFEMASNVTLMDKQWTWFLADVYPRLEPDASVIIVSTRWTGYDVIGRIRKAQQEDGMFEDWFTINFPALAGEKDILGRRPGQALFPKRWNEKQLSQIKKHMDPLWWESQYQGNPLPAKGGIIDTDWFKRYDTPPDKNDSEFIIISADTATKETEISDYTVIGIWFVHDHRYYLIDLIREKMDYPKLKETMKGLQGVWFPDFILIEDKGSGSSLIQDLRDEPEMNVRPIDTGNENKVLRLQAETPILRSGKVCIPEHSSWLDDFLLEMRAFPRGRKDQADMLSQFLKFMRKESRGIQMWSFGNV